MIGHSSHGTTTVSLTGIGRCWWRDVAYKILDGSFSKHDHSMKISGRLQVKIDVAGMAHEIKCNRVVGVTPNYLGGSNRYFNPSLWRLLVTVAVKSFRVQRSLTHLRLFA